ncbi:MAG: divergent PAP2 family protein [Dehalococcoidia bacterium]|nr:divergent PAP2 family protein [Dehalococcoidia bacterium]
MTIRDFTGNTVLIICIVAWAVAQVLKVIIIYAQEKRVAWSYFITSGGMPSSHAATVCALATGIAIEQGINTVAFTISAVLAIIVMYDAAGVRQSVGKQSVVLNRIIEELRLRRPFTEIEKDLKEFIGHTPFEVAAGAILGIVIAWVWLAVGG